MVKSCILTVIDYLWPPEPDQNMLYLRPYQPVQNSAKFHKTDILWKWANSEAWLKILRKWTNSAALLKIPRKTVVRTYDIRSD